MGKILIIRNSTYTPPASSEGSGTGSGSGSGSGSGTGTVTPTTLVDRLAAYFVAGSGFGSGNTWSSQANRASVQDIPVAEYFASRTITIKPTSAAGFSLRYGTANGLDGSNISTANVWIDSEQTYTIPDEAVYLGINLRFSDNSATAGSSIKDFLASVSD